MRRVKIAGQEWDIYELGIAEQIEVEVTLARVLGGATAVAIGAAVEGLAPAVIQALRDITGDGESFDLARLMDLWNEDDEGAGLSTKSPQMRRAWAALLDGLTETAGDIARTALPAITDRLTVPVAHRLFEITVISRADVVVNGVPRKIKNWDQLSKVLAGKPPGTKWRLFQAVIAVTYGGSVGEDEQDEQVLADEPIDAKE